MAHQIVSTHADVKQHHPWVLFSSDPSAPVDPVTLPSLSPQLEASIPLVHPEPPPPIDVVVMFYERAPFQDWMGHRLHEAYVGVSSMAYFRTCPIRLHLITHAVDLPLFMDLQSRLLYDPANWHGTDLPHRTNATAPSL